MLTKRTKQPTSRCKATTLSRATVPILLAGALVTVAGCRGEEPAERAGMAPPSAEAVALHSMSATEAAQLTQAFRDANPPGTELGGYFDRAVLDQMLGEPGVAGIRIYYGLKLDGSGALVVVGVDAQGNDLDSGTIAELHRPCPPFCGDSSAFIR